MLLLAAPVQPKGYFSAPSKIGLLKGLNILLRIMRQLMTVSEHLFDTLKASEFVEIHATLLPQTIPVARTHTKHTQHF